MRESTVEKWLRRFVEHSGGLCVKVGVGGLPDRVCMWPDRVVEWVELKQPMGRLKQRQEYRVQQLRERGYVVWVLWTVQQVKDWARERLGITRLPASVRGVGARTPALRAVAGSGLGQNGHSANGGVDASVRQVRVVGRRDSGRSATQRRA